MGLIDYSGTQMDIPHEPGEWVKLRLLTGREMDLAQEARSDRLIDRVAGMGDALMGLRTPTSDQRPDDSLESRRQVYDPDPLINSALVGWSYDADPGDDPAGLLDARTRDWLWGVIVEANTRPPAPSPVGGPSLSSDGYRQPSDISRT